MMIVFLVSSIGERPRAIPALQERRKSSLVLARERSRTVSNIIQRLDGKIYIT